MVKFVLYGFLLWRAVILLAAMVILAVFSYSPIFSYIDALPRPNPFDYLYGLANFDGVHYLRIAQEGYKAEFSQAFFPLYPVLIKIVGIITFNNFLIAGLIVSHLSFLLGLVFFYKLTKMDFGEDAARWSVIFLLAFPTSFFFGAVYNEGLFFLLAVLGFYAGRKNQWLLAGIAGGLASATRFFGILLLPALATSFLEANIKNHLPLQAKISRSKICHLSFVICHLWFLLLIPLGLIVYMIWLKIDYDDPLLFLNSLSLWQKAKFTFPFQVFWRYLKIFATVPAGNYLFHVALFEFTTAISLGALSIYLFFRRPSYGLFSALILLTVFSTGTLTSLPRYALVIFPAFMVLPIIFKTVKKRVAVAGSFLFIFAWSFARFITGQWVA